MFGVMMAESKLQKRLDKPSTHPWLAHGCWINNPGKRQQLVAAKCDGGCNITYDNGKTLVQSEYNGCWSILVIDVDDAKNPINAAMVESGYNVWAGMVLLIILVSDQFYSSWPERFEEDGMVQEDNG